MAVASVTKITAASSEGFDAAVREGLARANKTLLRHHRPSRNRAQGERGERKNR
jgi:flavin-binding protein dodecin